MSTKTAEPPLKKATRPVRKVPAAPVPPRPSAHAEPARVPTFIQRISYALKQAIRYYGLQRVDAIFVHHKRVSQLEKKQKLRDSKAPTGSKVAATLVFPAPAATVTGAPAAETTVTPQDRIFQRVNAQANAGTEHDKMLQTMTKKEYLKRMFELPNL
ncbi:MAG: hypothetical protein ACAI35_00910 [Candidatus Methylacidiphilales bacterium]